MKTNHTSNLQRHLLTAVAAATILGSLALPLTSLAGGKATDPAGAPSTGGAGGGGGTSTGGGAGGGKPVVKPVTVPILTAPLTFTTGVTINNVTPQATGLYRIDPYYPTLSLLTVNMSASSIADPDNTAYYVTVHTNSPYYLYTSTFSILGGAGTGTVSGYIPTGVTVTSVTVSDATGAVILTGN